MRKIKIRLEKSLLGVYLFIMTCLLSVNSCKHNNFVGFEGPAQCVSANFAITKAFNTPDSVDFRNDSVIFTVAFNEVVSWTIIVTGQTSGATVTFTGKSDSINTVWKGNPGSIVFFQAENATVELKVPCRESVFKSIKIIGKPNFKNYGVLMNDFDGNGVSGFTQYSVTGAKGIVSTPPVSPQGGNYYHADGGNPPPVLWYYGEIGSTSTTFSLAKLGTSNPDSVYFNALIGSGTITTGSIVIQLRGNNNYSYTYKPDGTGWKMLSLKVSDFKPLSPGPSANPLKITSVTFDLGPTATQGQPCELDLDMVIFTKGHPFF